MNNIIKSIFTMKKQRDAKVFWSKKPNPCLNSRIIFDSIENKTRGSMMNILEFGCSSGGNLKYFMDRMPGLKTTGVDVNRIVIDLSKYYTNYTGIVGDENKLQQFKDKEFDLVFTASVLDHIPSGEVVEDIIGQFLRISRHTLLLEPFIDGVVGDVSDRSRDEIKKGLIRGDKRFASFSYIWNYDDILNKKGVNWCKLAIPLHEASLGPFYHLYCVPSEVLASEFKKEVLNGNYSGNRH